MSDNRIKKEINTNKHKSKISAKEITMIGMLGAISAILMILEFPVLLAPGFIKMDFSDLPVILGGYLLGPLAGTMIVLVKIIMNFILNGTETMGIGELANMLGSLSYMLPAVWIYRKKKCKKSAVKSLIAGTLTVSVAITLANYFFIFPAYASLFGLSMESIVAMGKSANPYVTDVFTLMVCSILPFNLFKYGCVSTLTFLIYKKMGSLMRRFWD